MADDIKKIHDREAKWQKKWADAGVFTPKNDGTKQPFYMLAEFPFPSGTGLHGGHMLNYTGCDVMARFRRMQGYDVLYPLGFDSLGISAENYATKIGKHPSVVVRDLVERFTKNMVEMGWSIDLKSQVATSDPEFIKWTQWMFIQFFNAGLAYKSMLPMNWCPNCRTTLTNEELEDGKCNRCHGPVEIREKMQWNLAITKYAQRLLDDLSLVDYPERVKRDQTNWIGKSTGADVDFMVGDDVMTVYTTRPDTIFGATFCAIAPEHKLVAKWLADGRVKNADAVRAYIKEAAAKSEIDRTDVTKEKTGVQLDGIMAKNPYTGDEIPVFVADYVLVNYAHGTIMAVPAHDDRDWDFAKKFGLKIVTVIDGGEPGKVWIGDGPHINSGFMDGMNKADAIAAAIKYGEEHGFARPKTRFKMSDWGFSRQMYWGEPIPLVYCEKCGWVPVPESELPLMQPYMEDYRPTEDGESPLARATDWVNTTCPKCGAPARRETDTMPQWAGSSWYYMRYLDPHNDKEFCSREQMERWMPVDHYNGGNEHNTRHLIYSRFWHKALYDLGFVNTVEPYKKRTTNGLLMGSDGKKMSKSAGNGFQVDEMVARVGADAARTTVLSLGPWDTNVNWSDGALAGVQRFLKRVENMADNLTDAPMNAEQERLVNQLIADMTDRLENMRFNTAISAMMEFINQFDGKMPRPAYEILVQVLNPFAPHLTEEIWQRLGHDDMLVFQPWPTYDASKLVKTTMTMVASVNGKRAAEFQIGVDATNDEVIAMARDVAAKKLDGVEIVKTIVVPNKLVNFVVKK
ncbi:MAG TPA: leucine--tRNA ligase [Candidatus Enterousia intestinigallinarum]|uniref:Leucine--tRNA ligase n=1 Tax=Candidatus Enterousia intestinigallinarum TaxID=2840790 RepID=A0A9D1JWL2_9PROT|nr:leucine--tRNA ligase [Candidatus Enterousia intestinigallinarum]